MDKIILNLAEQLGIELSAKIGPDQLNDLVNEGLSKGVVNMAEILSKPEDKIKVLKDLFDLYAKQPVIAKEISKNMDKAIKKELPLPERFIAEYKETGLANKLRASFWQFKELADIDHYWPNLYRFWLINAIKPVFDLIGELDWTNLNAKEEKLLNGQDAIICLLLVELGKKI